MNSVVKWSLVGVGVILVYAAFKNEKVSALLKNVTGASAVAK